MAWFKRDKKSIEQSTPPEERRVRTEGLWVKCESCRTIVFRKDLEANLFVCPKCQFHFKMNSKQRLEMLLDGRWTEHDAGMTSTDPLKFVDTKPYAARLREAKKKLGMKDRKSTRLNSSHVAISYAVFCLKKKRKYKEGAIDPHDQNDAEKSYNLAAEQGHEHIDIHQPCLY